MSLQDRYFTVSGNNSSLIQNINEMNEEIKLTLEDIRKKTVSIKEKRRLKKIYNLYSDGNKSNNKTKKGLKDFFGLIERKYKKTKIWKGGLQNIDYKFGPGVYSYFLFIQKIFYLNLLMAFLTFCFQMLPSIISDVKNKTECAETNSTECCTAEYFNEKNEENIILDLIQGSGILEKTLIFIGTYTPDIIKFKLFGEIFYYDIPLGFIITTLINLLISLIFIMKGITKGFKEIPYGEQLQYTQLVFASWNFSLKNRKYLEKNHRNVSSNIKKIFESETLENERKRILEESKNKFIAIRILLNVLAFAILAGCGTAIYFTFKASYDYLEKNNEESEKLDLNHFVNLFYEFLPSLVIVGFNGTLPLLFQIIVIYENYSTIFRVRLTILRNIVIRLFSISVLYYTLYSNGIVERESWECAGEGGTLCWETLFGQQMYKLALTDFFIHILLTFLVNYPRHKLGELDNKFAKFFGEQLFDLPRNVLDIVYMQIVCWFGSFYAPILSIMFVPITFVMFYLKKFVCMVNSVPSQLNTSKTTTESMFMIILLICYVFAAIPLALSWGEFLPSRACGPFRDLKYMWELIEIDVTKISWLDEIASYLNLIYIQLFVILCLLIYSYVCVISVNQQNIKYLKKKLNDSKDLKNKIKLQARM